MNARNKILISEVGHFRHLPKVNSFKYKLFWLYFDLDDLESKKNNSFLFKYNKFSILSIKSNQYLNDSKKSIKEKVNKYLLKFNKETAEKITLLTVPNLFGYSFNPVNFYFCYQNEKLKYNIVEINNTFKERHLYILDKNKVITEKDFHVSPFFKLNFDYQFEFKNTDSKIDIKIDLYKDNTLHFESYTKGELLDYSNKNLSLTLAKFPFSASLTMLRILYQAGILYYIKKLQFNTKPIPMSQGTIKYQEPSYIQRKYINSIHKILKNIKNSNLIIVHSDKSEYQFGDSKKEANYIYINNYKFYKLLILKGAVGFGKAYQKDFFYTDNLKNLLELFLDNRKIFEDGISRLNKISNLTHRFIHKLHSNTKKGSKKNIHDHYDLSNRFFDLFLDPLKQYSSGVYLKESDSLDQAQFNKIDTIINKLNIKDGDSIIEIGCGWGGLALEIAKRLNVKITTTTISKKQFDQFSDLINKTELKGEIELLFKDYRDLEGQFDKAISIEMIEAVGDNYLEVYFNKIKSLLKPSGSAFIQAICIPDYWYDRYLKQPDWIQLEVFPGCCLPSLKKIKKITSDINLELTDDLDIAKSYSKTLDCWQERFNQKIKQVKDLGFDDHFIRTWNYYFSYCSAGFNKEFISNFQLVFQKN